MKIIVVKSYQPCHLYKYGEYSYVRKRICKHSTQLVNKNELCVSTNSWTSYYYHLDCYLEHLQKYPYFGVEQREALLKKYERLLKEHNLTFKHLKKMLVACAL